MAKIATWLRAKDECHFRRFFAKHPGIRIYNRLEEDFAVEETDGLLLTGGPDIAPEFLRQELCDTSLIRSPDAKRDAWEFVAIQVALARALPILAICKGMQTLNVTLGGTLFLDIRGHDAPEQKSRDVQPLHNDRSARHRFDQVNSSHHQAVENLGLGLEVEAWCASDGIIEQVRLRGHPFALAVQYHPERGHIYDELFDDFCLHVRRHQT